MNLTDSQKKIFAILFAAGEPLETDRLAEALAISHAEAAEQCVLLQQRLAESDLPLELRRLENSWQLCTIAGYDTVIRTALELRSNTPLSNAAMEVLAVVAYNQPVTRSFIEQVRGVDLSGGQPGGKRADRGGRADGAAGPAGGFPDNCRFSAVLRPFGSQRAAGAAAPGGGRGDRRGRTAGL